MLAIQAVLLVPLTLVDSVAALAAAMAIAGLVVAPVATVAFGLLDRVAPAGTATEATSWLITAYQLGLAAARAGPGRWSSARARPPPSPQPSAAPRSRSRSPH